MALVLTKHTPHTSATEGTTTTSGTYTIASGRRILVLGKFINGGSGTDAPGNVIALTDTGASLTWTRQDFADNGNTDFSAASIVWTATSNGTPFTLTATKTGIGVGSWCLNVYDFSGAHATTFVGALASEQLGGNDGAQSMTLSGTPASTSMVIASMCAVLNSGDVNAIEGAGWTEEYDTPHTDWAMRHVQSRTGSTSTTVAWADVSVGGGGIYHNPVAVAIEIIAAEESGGTVNTETLSDTVTVSDGFTNFLRFNRLLADSLLITDQLVSQIIAAVIQFVTLTSNIVVTDTLIARQWLTRLLQSLVVVTEGATDRFTNTNIDAIDEITVEDQTVSWFRRNRLLQDSVAITDELIANIVGYLIYVQTLTSAISVTDQAQPRRYFQRLLDSQLLTTDQAQRAVFVTRDLLDSIEVADSGLTALQRFILLTDAISLDDSLTSLVFTPVTVNPVVVIGFDQPRIELGGYAL